MLVQKYTRCSNQTVYSTHVVTWTSQIESEPDHIFDARGDARASQIESESSLPRAIDKAEEGYRKSGLRSDLSRSRTWPEQFNFASAVPEFRMVSEMFATQIYVSG